jgi:tetratricopeptide (TPR) repeat protein
MNVTSSRLSSDRNSSGWWITRPVSRVLAPVLPFLFMLVIVSAAVASTEAPQSDVAAPTADNTPATNAPKQAATALNPTVAERLLIANSYLEKNKLDDALSVVDELAGMRKLKPTDRAQISRFRGYILLAKNDIEGGGRAFEAALAENALDEGSRQGMIYSLAQIYTQAGKYDRARELMDDWFASAKDPKPEAWFLKAMILVQQEDFRGALEPALKANELSATPRESWLQLLAAVQFQLQDMEAVAATLRRLVAAAPGTKRYWVQLATVENSLGKEDSALATLGVARAGDLLTEDKEYRQHARMCFVNELPRCCTETLEEGMASGIVKADAETWQLLANCYIASREIDKALEPLAKAGDLAENANGYLLLGQIQLQKERFEAARDALAKARTKAKSEERGQVELLLGIAELGSERYDAAERSFRVAQADAKTRPAAESYLKHLEQKRALRAIANPDAIAGDAAGDPVSSAGTSNDASRL